MLGGSKLIAGILLISAASCLSSVKQKFAGFFPTPETAAIPEQEKRVALLPPVVVTTPTPSPTPKPIAINTGSAVIAAGGPSQTFVRRASKNVCPSGVDAKILYFNASTAVLVRRNCKDLEPTTLPNGSFAIVPNDQNILVFEKIAFDRDVPGGSSAVLSCDGGKDSAGRDISIILKADAANALKARLSIKGSGGNEAFDFPVLESKKNQLRIFEAPKTADSPAFALSIGNFNGLTGFATYNFFSSPGSSGQAPVLKTKGLLSENRKETNLNLPHCVSQ